MFSSARGRLFNGRFRTFRRFFTNGESKNSRNSSGYFDDRTLGLLTLLVSVPTAAYIWKHHKSSNVAEFVKLNEMSEPKANKSLLQGKKKKAKYLIIGGGAAGFSAIQAIKEADSEAQIILVSKEPIVPYLRPPLSKELWFSENQKQIGSEPENLVFTDWHGNEKPLEFEKLNFYQNMGVETILGCEAIGFDLEKRRVELCDGQILEFDRLLIATGSEPKIIDAPIEETAKNRVSTFRNVSDFIKLYNLLKEKEGQNIVVVGGGFLGSELAVSVSKIGNQMNHSVTQVFPENGHMGLVFPKYLSQWTTEKVSKLGVKVKSGRSVSSIEGKEDSSSVKLVLDNGEELLADHVIVAVGVDPSLRGCFKSSLAVDKEFGGLEADKFLQVAPGVFAAGDVVSYLDPVLGCRRRTEHFDHAILSGKLAGLNMVRSFKQDQDQDQELEPYSNQSMFWSDLGPEVGYEAVGLVDSSLTTVGVWARAHSIESPQGTELDTSDIRVQTIGQTSISTAEPKFSQFPQFSQFSQLNSEGGPVEIESDEIKTEISTSAEISPSYGKGVVFYLKERQIVGILLFNLFNRVNLAKEILKEKRSVDEISKCVRLFNVEEIV